MIAKHQGIQLDSADRVPFTDPSGALGIGSSPMSAQFPVFVNL